jgi:hypothetical protein
MQKSVPSHKLVTVNFHFIFLRSVHRLLVTANVPSSPILVTLMIEAPSSSLTSVLTRATRRNIPKDGIVHSHRRAILKSYNEAVCHECACEDPRFLDLGTS